MRLLQVDDEVAQFVHPHRVTGWGDRGGAFFFDDDGFLLNDVDGIPRNLSKACVEYALRAAIQGVLAPDPLLPVPAQSLETGASARATDAISGEVIRKKQVVDVIEEETWYQPASRTSAENISAAAKSVQSSMVNDFSIPEYPEADLWIEELLISGTSTDLSRA